MRIGNFERELSEQRVEQEKETAIAAARSALSGLGKDECEDCGKPIGEARRRAMPSATRCVICQTIHEREQRKVIR
ncbi:TraR/DksA C4-type zinc finger protein [Ensifer aridi]|uniref:TraR/DksA C4-type zinc finger protein n=1 Tax=Ensifer aridi TaxID=1708715 RepID=UPI000A1209A3|nr:TraR/DksA C4-type zinc finger protein [Ensifer aridi]